MPSGGSTPLNADDWQIIEADFTDACDWGLQYEWLKWFIGGLVEDKLPVRDASYAARIEWDF